jgi:hypothetical protein
MYSRRPLAWMKLQQEDEKDDDAYRPATPVETERLKAALAMAGYSAITPDPTGLDTRLLRSSACVYPRARPRHESVVIARVRRSISCFATPLHGPLYLSKPRSLQCRLTGRSQRSVTDEGARRQSVTAAFDANADIELPDWCC